MTGERGSWTQILARARERLLTQGEVEEGSGPRQEILDSWRRSYDDGASRGGVVSPYDENLNLASKLVRAAEPVLGRVHEDVLGSPITVVLADSRGKVLLRRSGETSLESTLDSALLAPGFNYAEKYVGTNGIGTALEGRTTSMVRGFEHFNDQLQVFACVGVPLRDPVTRRQLGVLDITTWADRADPALTALVRQAATVIEEGLLELSSRGARELLQQYLLTSRKREDEVLAVSEESLIATAGAVRNLANLGREELWAATQDALRTRDEADVPLLTPTGTVILRVRAVRGRYGDLAGALVEICSTNEGRAAPVVLDPLPAHSGLSPVTVGPGAVLRRLAAARTPVALIGEPGVGKRTMVESVAAEQFTDRLLQVLDAEVEAPDDLVTATRERLRAGQPVLLRSAQLLAPGTVARLVEPAITDAPTGWLAFTLHSASPSAPDGVVEAELSRAGVPLVVVPPLRSRVQDLHRLVPEMATRLSGGRVTGATTALLDRLVREPWPRNLSEVHEVVLDMVTRTPRTVLDVADLPPQFGSGVRRRLTALEWMERDAIIDALRNCQGDKSRAAEVLGISRASIYRKLKSYDIAPRDLAT